MLTIFRRKKQSSFSQRTSKPFHPIIQLVLAILFAFITFSLFTALQLIPEFKQLTPITMAVTYLIGVILLFAIVYWFVNKQQQNIKIVKPMSIGKGIKISIYMAILIIVLQMGIGIIQILILGDQPQVSANQSSVESLVNNERTYYLMIAMILIGAPLSEELVFRGILIGKIPVIKTKMFYFRVFLSVVSFALIHLVLELKNGLTLEELFPLAIYLAISAVVTFVYVRTGSLWFSILTHFFNNAIGILAILSAS